MPYYIGGPKKGPSVRELPTGTVDLASDMLCMLSGRLFSWRPGCTHPKALTHMAGFLVLLEHVAEKDASSRLTVWVLRSLGQNPFGRPVLGVLWVPPQSELQRDGGSGVDKTLHGATTRKARYFQQFSVLMRKILRVRRKHHICSSCLTCI